MRTFRTLVAGWLAGAALIVLLAWPAMTKDRLRAAGMAKPSPVGTNARSLAPAPPITPITTQDGVRHIEVMTGPIVIPVAGIVESDLVDTYTQARSGGRTHNAIDILAPQGTPVIAAVDGTIRKFFTSGAGGLTIYQYDVNEERVYYYAHLERYDDRIAEGQFVTQGTVLGYVGTTGNAGNTPHLHFSIEVLPPTKEWWKGQAVNPYPILVSANDAPATTRASVQQ
ncbi:MAG TPA: M23 family metallopeptidase [Thermoanaerobaculia bacterium]